MSNFKDFTTKYIIRIPMIQRDYVQGLDANAKKRDKFLRNLLSSLRDGTELPMDFIYGTIDHEASVLHTEKDVFEPLDGQQRLTTLCLLCLILSKRSGVELDDKVADTLKNFSYTTRTSSSAFCEKLFSDTSAFPRDHITQFLENRPWYSVSWNNDPTVKAMKEMLDKISSILNLEDFTGKEIQMANNLYGENGLECPIVFDELNMGDYNLSDALYIKMNARGKQLNDFENWKAGFIKFLALKYEKREIPEDCRATERKDICTTYKSYFEYSIEHQWTDMLWPYAYQTWNKLTDEDKEDVKYPVIDEYFMRLFYYLLRMLYFVKNDKVIDKITGIERDVMAADFDAESQTMQESLLADEKNLQFLFSALDFFHAMSPTLFDDLFYATENVNEEFPNNGKVRLFVDDKSVNLFIKSILGGEAFDVKQQLLMLCIIKYGIKYHCTTATPEMKDYARCCRNIVESISQRLAKDVVIRPNIRLADLKKYSIAIDKLIAQPNVVDALKQMTDDEIKRLGMCDIQSEKTKAIDGFYDSPMSADILQIENGSWLRGNLSIFETSLLSQPMNVIDALKSFAAMSDSERIRLLISFGFRGEDFGRTMLGMRRFFGGRDNNNDRWNVIFSGFSKEETRKAVNAYISQYKGNAKNMIAEIQLPTQHNFAYYTLTYPEFLSASLGNAPKYYFTVQGRLDDCDIEALGSYSSNPLLSYHTEPFACCVAALFSNRNKSIYEDLEWSSRYAYKAALYMKRKGIGIRMEKGFWNILCEDDVTLDQTVQNKFRVQNGTELHEAPNQDLITTAVDFVESIYTLQPDK